VLDGSNERTQEQAYERQPFAKWFAALVERGTNQGVFVAALDDKERILYIK
jgi:hypothetical protein